MPPLRTERAGKACDTCRRQKTRCYPSEVSGTCLRCKTQQLQCSLSSTKPSSTLLSTAGNTENVKTAALHTIDQRLARLEQSMNILIERNTTSTVRDDPPQVDENTAPGYISRQSSTELDPAPVVMIRNAAGTMLAKPVHLTDNDAAQRVSQFAFTGEADHLLCLFYEHYGRWVRFEEGTPSVETINQLKSSRLLLCSILLIVIRHSSENVINNLSSALLIETKRLLGQVLLQVVDTLDIFRALLILSLWSTSVGGEPLGVDGWLLTSYAIHHARVSPIFGAVFRKSRRPLKADQLNAWCVWNHLCDAHLQYCVGTRRISVLDTNSIATCPRLMTRCNASLLGNFETRMIAEVKLYFITYQQCTGQIDREATEQQLSAWKVTFSDLFDQPRAQFLQMGYYFALLLTLTRSIRTKHSSPHSNLDELIRLITSNLHLATETADERAQYLTDHIYHIVVFSALTLCQILTRHEQALEISHDVAALDALLARTVEWLRGIATVGGGAGHVTYLLARVVESQTQRYRKGKLGSRSQSQRERQEEQEREREEQQQRQHETAEGQELFMMTTMMTPDVADSMFAYPDYLMTDLYDFAGSGEAGNEQEEDDGDWQTWQDIT